MTSKKFYLTTPLYYVNDVPHIGHSYTNILADCVARFRRLEGYEVFFLTGTDEHGDKIARAAQASNEKPQEFVDRISPRFKALWTALGITHDDFIRTTQERHVQTVTKALQQLREQGDIYEGQYEGFYCTPCETFWADTELLKGLCPDCNRAVEAITEKNYFFRMSRYQKWLIEMIEAQPEFIRPASRRNEMLGFLESGLKDLCISRPRGRLSWGIVLPFDSGYVTYVWVDALMNYISACGWVASPEHFRRFWPADLHLIGKDILRHHAVTWITLLKALGLSTPKTILAHGWWTVQGEKMSKSKGNVIDPNKVIAQWGRDAYRYFLLREVPVGQDGDFSQGSMASRYKNDLGNDLGNLVNRTLSMIGRYFKGHVPEPSYINSGGLLRDASQGLGVRLKEKMSQYDFKGALEAVWKVVEQANQYVEHQKPWALAKAKKQQELADVLYNLAETVRILGIYLEPFLPDSAEAISDMLNPKKVTPPPASSPHANGLRPFGTDAGGGVTNDRWKAAASWGGLRPNAPLGQARILFPRKDLQG